MKQSLLSLLIVAGLQQNTKAQTFDYLDANNIKARADTGGFLFTNAGAPGFEAPQGSGKYTVVNSHIIMGGQTGASILHLAAAHDFRPGWLSPGGIATPSTSSAWNRVWKINANDISYHIANYDTPGYIPAAAIADWPAFTELGASMAPFMDVDGDPTTYNPLAGDYPLIKGTQAIFQTFHDNCYHGTGGQVMNLEIHCMAYVFGCTEDSALNNTVFVDYDVINRGSQTFYNTYFGLNDVLSIGNFADNYMGCDVKRGMYYCYNGDSTDEASSFSPNYNDILPMQGVIILSGPYQDADGLTNGINPDYTTAVSNGGIPPYEGVGFDYDNTIPDDERMGLRKFMSYTSSSASEINPPTVASEFYNALNGLWPDGTQPCWGGCGFPGFSGVTTTPVDYLYYDDTDPYLWASHGATIPTTNPWREDLHNNIKGDRNSVASMGPFTLDPGAYNHIEVAYTFACDYTQTHVPLAALPLLQQRADSIRSYYSAATGPCGDFTFMYATHVAETNANEASYSLYPNPATNGLTLSVKTAGKTNVFIIHDVAGKLVQSGNLNNNTTSIDVSSFENGIYLITLNHTHTQKFVVQH